MNKKAQVTIFIIAGILIVAAIGFFFTFRSSVTEEEYIILDTSNVKSFVEDCISQTSTEIIQQISNGGGYYFAPPNSVDGLAIYYADGQKMIPSKEDIQNEISQYLTENLFYCTNNFENFADLEIEPGEISVETAISDEEIKFDVNYPISIAKGEDVDLIKTFSKTIPVRLGIIYDASDEIVDSSKDNVCLSCILDISSENDVSVSMNDLDENKTMFVITDDNSKLNGKSLDWTFVIDYA